MDNIAKAKKYINWNNERWVVLDSRLKDTDYKQEEKTRTYLKFFKQTYFDEVITEAYAKQYIDMTFMYEHKRLLDIYIKQNEKALGRLNNEVKEQIITRIETAKIIKNTCELSLNHYKQKLDTPKFDAAVHKFTEIIEKTIIREEMPSVSIVFGYDVKQVNPLSQDDKNWITKFEQQALAVQQEKGSMEQAKSMKK